MASKTSSSAGLERRLRHESYSRSIRRLQRHLKPSERRLSVIIHQTTVEALSEGLNNTVGRASGLFGAGLAGVVGSTVLMVVAKKNSFSYNYYWVLGFLAGGFIFGLLVEWLVRRWARP